MFKVGDKVRRKLSALANDGISPGEEFIVVALSPFLSGAMGIVADRGSVGNRHDPENLELISSSETISEKKNIVSTISSLIKKITRGEPEKTFVEVGFLDGHEEITLDGKDALVNILWEKNKDALKELADKIKKVQEEEK